MITLRNIRVDAVHGEDGYSVVVISQVHCVVVSFLGGWLWEGLVVFHSISAGVLLLMAGVH